jgi:NADH:ubiquinone oxidoreductase subunit F (NADH-binding)
MPQAAYEEIRSAAEASLSAHANKFRVAVQVGHCSASVGAENVVEAFEEDLLDNAHLVVTGCDGGCWNAPTVVVTDPDGASVRLPRVDFDTAVRISTMLEGGAAPLRYEDDSAFLSGQTRVALDGCGELDALGINEYFANGGYEGLAAALSASPEAVIAQVKASGLRGRGGAYFPAALKWEGARKAAGGPRYLVVNSEEGEPGLFKDRHLMEGLPHKVIEGALIAAYAAGAEAIFIYINAEADLSSERMARAVAGAKALGLVGDDVLGSGWPVSMEIRRGAGGYVCGEETTLLNTMEGYRREPRLRPPFPTESGYLSRPTVINNAETLSNLPFILAKGAEAFAAIGVEGASGTKVLSLSGAVRRPGLVEVPFGTPLRGLVMDIGGGPPEGRPMTALGVGGPSSGLLPPDSLDLKMMPGMLHESGVMLGAGGLVALDETVGVVEAMRALAAYNADESCGKCTPCREGTPRMVEAIDRLASGNGSQADLDGLVYLAEVVGSTSLCGLGQAAGGPITSFLHFFPGALHAGGDEEVD